MKRRLKHIVGTTAYQRRRDRRELERIARLFPDVRRRTGR